MKKIIINESQKKLLGEISYGTVDKAYDRAKLFYNVKCAFEDFYNTVNDAIFDAKYNDIFGNGSTNPYLEKIKELADPIYDILNRKSEQQDNFFNATTGSIDHNKFFNSSDADENDIDDMDLTYLKRNYPK